VFVNVSAQMRTLACIKIAFPCTRAVSERRRRRRSCSSARTERAFIAGVRACIHMATHLSNGIQITCIRSPCFYDNFNNVSTKTVLFSIQSRAPRKLVLIIYFQQQLCTLLYTRNTHQNLHILKKYNEIVDGFHGSRLRIVRRGP
jgi:hypothetical protein